MNKVSNFVCGFFRFLEAQGVASAILHGGEHGFSKTISDVDFAVAACSYPRLPVLISAYCNQAGWQLCQVLRHETTAAYFVCSAMDDPACAVALDACSDYQRNGTLFLKAEELIANRRKFDWGGHGLAPELELCYRFAKAAAKNKPPEDAMNEFSGYPAGAKKQCADWLEKTWAIGSGYWDDENMAERLASLSAISSARPPLWKGGAWKRILQRIIQPSGLIVQTETDIDVSSVNMLASVFGHLYFRKLMMLEQFNPSHLKNLVSSTLVIVSKLDRMSSLLVPGNCIFKIDSEKNMDCQIKKIAEFLAERTKIREN